jgi:hypothetical protein
LDISTAPREKSEQVRARILILRVRGQLLSLPQKLLGCRDASIKERWHGGRKARLDCEPLNEIRARSSFKGAHQIATVQECRSQGIQYDQVSRSGIEHQQTTPGLLAERVVGPQANLHAPQPLCIPDETRCRRRVTGRNRLTHAPSHIAQETKTSVHFACTQELVPGLK